MVGAQYEEEAPSWTYWNTIPRLFTILRTISSPQNDGIGKDLWRSFWVRHFSYFNWLSIVIFLYFNLNNFRIDCRLQMGGKSVIVINDWENVKEAFAKDAFNGRPHENVFDTFQKQTSKRNVSKSENNF